MVQITGEKIDVRAAADSVTTPESGGIDLFIGTTRNHSKNRAVAWLEYEAYESMALKMMERLEEEARSRWPISKAVLIHRIGRVDIGEASVVIAVSSAHRKEAFEACRFLIDKLKQVVPIWKREFFADGTVEWSRQYHAEEGTTETL